MPSGPGSTHMLERRQYNFSSKWTHIQPHVLWSCNLSSPKNFKIRYEKKNASAARHANVWRRIEADDEGRRAKNSKTTKKENTRKQTVCVCVLLLLHIIDANKLNV